MASTSAAGGTTGLNSAVAARPRPNFPAVREIHKNAWLKRLPSQDKRGAHFSTRKPERFWVVFCVHNDEEAFLEFYTEPKMATIHKPQCFLSLNSCLHVSVSIIGQDNEYQFTVTLASEVVRLVAANWDQMIEWVESLQGKLREMNILSPKDNLYSKLPDTTTASKCIGALASTHRDPTSPLPLPPIVGASNSQNHFQLRPVVNHCVNVSCTVEPTNRRSGEISQTSECPPSELNNLSQLSLNGNSSASAPREMNLHPCALPNTSNNVPVEFKEDNLFCQSTVPVEQTDNSRYVSTVNINVNAGFQMGASLVASSRNAVAINDTIFTPNDFQTLSQLGENNVSSTSIGVTQTQGPSENIQDLPFPESSFANLNVASNRMGPAARVTEAVRKEKKPPQRAGVDLASSSLKNNSDAGTSSQQNLKVSLAKKSCSTENIYEHIYLPSNRLVKPPNNGQVQNGSQANGNAYSVRLGESSVLRQTTNELRPEDNNMVRLPQDSSNSHNSRMRKVSGTTQRASSLGRIEFVYNAGVNRDAESSGTGPAVTKNGEISCPRQQLVNEQSSIIPRSVGNSTFFGGNNEHSNGDSPPWLSGGDLQGMPISTLIGSRNGEYRIRRDTSFVRMGETGDIGVAENDNHVINRDQVRSVDEMHTTGIPLPLKEQQVVNLQNEINHPGGVRMVLKKRDCLNSIAFVDYLGAVWVAGWKQTQFPVLYYGFHVGDQLLKVAGSVVQSSLEASRAIKSSSSAQVEFILRRIPYGKVFALKRSRDGEPLGLVAEGSSGEISEVLKDGLAARYGLPPKGLSVDGRVPCNWYLTEVNNRPLSLMSKENEVKDRLNAVGKEISILVQPADLVKHLRKSLKSYKNFKDYIVG